MQSNYFYSPKCDYSFQARTSSISQDPVDHDDATPKLPGHATVLQFFPGPPRLKQARGRQCLKQTTQELGWFS